MKDNKQNTVSKMHFPSKYRRRLHTSNFKLHTLHFTLYISMFKRHYFKRYFTPYFSFSSYSAVPISHTRPHTSQFKLFTMHRQLLHSQFQFQTAKLIFYTSYFSLQISQDFVIHPIKCQHLISYLALHSSHFALQSLQSKSTRYESLNCEVRYRQFEVWS